MTGIKRMLQAIERNTNAEELNNPPNIDEEHRKTTYPDICTPECEHVTCPYRTEENRGRPCFMKWKQYETPPPPHAKASLTQSIETAVAQAFAPIEERLRRLEDQSEYERQPHLRGFNGSPIPAGFPRLYREIRGGKNRNG